MITGKTNGMTTISPSNPPLLIPNALPKRKIFKNNIWQKKDIKKRSKKINASTFFVFYKDDPNEDIFNDYIEEPGLKTDVLPFEYQHVSFGIVSQYMDFTNYNYYLYLIILLNIYLIIRLKICIFKI